MKKASVEEQRRLMVNLLRRQLFEKFKQEVSMNKSKGEGEYDEKAIGGKESTEGVEEVRTYLEKVSVKENQKDKRAGCETEEKERDRASPLTTHSGA
ncbi:hypothetical protein ACS0TY_014728 [Phlomoides rotata]